MMDALGELARSFGDVLAPIIKDLTLRITQFTNRFTDLDDGTKRLILAIAGVVAAIGPMLLIVPKVMAAITALRTAMIALNAAMNANPIGMRPWTTSN